jgi:hypothetical protein
MSIPERFRDPVALVEASVLGVAGVVVALLGPWPLLATVAGPLIVVVVLMIATRGSDQSSPSPLTTPPDSLVATIRRWANELPDDADPTARARADDAVASAGEVDTLIFYCRRRNQRLADGAERRAAEESLDTIIDYVTRAVSAYSSRPPVRAHEWGALARPLINAKDALRAELGERTQSS